MTRSSKGDQMGLITGIVLLLLGVLAASSSIIQRRPDAQKYIEMLRPYQGWVGFGGCLWGLWIILSALWHLNWLGWIPLWWLTYAAAGVLLAGLGFLMGYPLLSQYILSKNPEVAKHGETALARLTPFQINLGYVGIGLGIWTFIAKLIWGVG
jgi:hypothetical protein